MLSSGPDYLVGEVGLAEDPIANLGLEKARSVRGAPLALYLPLHGGPI